MALSYNLSIEEENNVTEHLFYNSTGGKDKCLAFNVFLIDQAGEKVFDRFVHLKVSLVYDDGQYVNNQDILEVKDDAKCIIDSTPSHIRFRINEVSSHHQGHKFRIMVTPTEMSVPMLLTPVFSAPIEVKSKPVRHRELDGTLELDSGRKSKPLQNIDVLYNIANSATPMPNDAKLSRSESSNSAVSNVGYNSRLSRSGSSYSAVSNAPLSSFKLSRTGSNAGIAGNMSSSSDSVESVVAQLIPLVRSIKDTLSMHQIQQTDISSSISFPILCRFNHNASLFFNDMTLLADLLQHDKESNA